MDLTTVISNIIYTLVFFTIIIFIGIFIFSKKESGNKEKCLATCSSKDTTTKEFCDLECVEESCFDCGYKGPYDTMPNPDTDISISGSDPLIIAAKIKADSELLAAQNEAKTLTTQIISVASLLPPTTTLTLPPPPTSEATVVPMVPVVRVASGLADSCKIICSGPSGNHWDSTLCTDTCSEVKCWDCAYKGPYLDNPTELVSLLPPTTIIG
jgi:hypothetical protein